jgi:predicted nuclease of predicted toxin-antitoxin system
LKFKVDENLPTEYAPILREAGFEADTVSDEKLSGAGDSVLSERCRAEDRVLMTLDLDFANVQAYPPKSHPGIVVFRSKSQDKPTLVALLKRLVPALLQFSPKHQLWIVEPDRIRYREEQYSGSNDLNTDKGEVGGSSPPRPTIQITSKYASILTFPLFGALPKKPFCQPFVNFTIGRMALHSGR